MVPVHYFPKPCPHCKTPLERVHKFAMDYSRCTNPECPYVVALTKALKSLNEIDPYLTPYTECFNRR